MKKNLEEIKKDDLIFENMEGDFSKPDYNPETHYLELTRSKYFQALLVLRHHFKMISDDYFGNELGAKNIDLFMLTPSISSPTGPGSDSEPIWIKNFDRDRVPFYQKPDPENPERVICADLIFPPIIEGSFGGEIVGGGQRQDNEDEMRESLKRQNVDAEVYEWYINLRNLPNYEISSGFGLGVERFITWALARDDIKDAIPYPRLKNTRTYP